MIKYIIMDSLNKNKIKLAIIIFLFFLFSYYVFLFMLNKDKITENHYKEISPKNDLSLIEKFNELEKKDKSIQKIQKQIKQIFKKNEIKETTNEIKETTNEIKEKTFELSTHYFKKGETVYAFNLDNQEGNTESFQEGIVSDNYNSYDTKYLPISIKGKNNKIFFNKDWAFIGISAPKQDPAEELNYIITSNSIFYYLCYIHYSDEQQNLKDDQSLDLGNYFVIEFNIPHSVNPEEKFTKKIFLDQKGLFLGLYKQTKSQQKKPQDFYELILNMIKYENIQQKLQILQNDKKQKQKEKEKKEEEEPKKEKINNSKLKKIEQMTFLISSHNSLGSGFIFGIEEHTECKTNHFQYYVLTNRHVIDSKNQINYCAKIYNYFFGLKKAKIIGFIKNEDVYDDIAVLSFCDDIPDKYNTIKQNKKEIYPETEIYTFQGETIYSMGSQVSKMENLRVSFSSQSNPNPNTNINNIFQDNDKLNSNIELSLLKKGNIVSKHDKEISFDIQIDHGNSGGPVFNKNGEIIGMNKSTIIANDVPDNTSQSINIEHIKKIYNRIMCLHKKEPNKQYFKISPEDNYKFAKEEIESFELFSSKPSNKKRSINISIEELIDYLSCSETKKINSKKITKSDSNNEMKFIMESINIFSDKDTIFSIDPTKEEIEISFDPGKEQIVLSKYHNNKQIIKQIDDKKLNNKQFFSFKLIDKLNPNPKESNEHAKKLQKIKNSLIVWNQNKNKSGNGIIFYREKISNNNYLYFVLSTYNIDKEKLEHITEPIKNIFDNEVEITNFYNENSKKEKGEIKTFYFENKNLALITFESSHKYDTVKIRPIKDLVLGEEIFSLINTDKDDYIPQMFKSNVGYKDKDYNYILCDSVFNLKSKKINSGSPLSLLYFDSESNFIGTNDILDKDKDQVPDYFNKISFLKEENFKMLLYKNKFKDNFNLLFSVFFIIVMFWIFIFKIDIKAIF